MAEIINLRKHRKAKARATDENTAAENRVKFGRTRQERERQATEEARAVRQLDGHRLTTPQPDKPAADKP
jgi:hypothetical protein